MFGPDFRRPFLDFPPPFFRGFPLSFKGAFPPFFFSVFPPSFFWERLFPLPRCSYLSRRKNNLHWQNGAVTVGFAPKFSAELRNLVREIPARKATYFVLFKE